MSAIFLKHAASFKAQKEGGKIGKAVLCSSRAIFAAACVQLPSSLTTSGVRLARANCMRFLTCSSLICSLRLALRAAFSSKYGAFLLCSRSSLLMCAVSLRSFFLSLAAVVPSLVFLLSVAAVVASLAFLLFFAAVVPSLAFFLFFAAVVPSLAFLLFFAAVVPPALAFRAFSFVLYASEDILGFTAALVVAVFLLSESRCSTKSIAFCLTGPPCRTWENRAAGTLSTGDVAVVEASPTSTSRSINCLPSEACPRCNLLANVRRPPPTNPGKRNLTVASVSACTG